MLAVAPDQVHLDRAAGADDPDRTDGLVFRYTAPALSLTASPGGRRRRPWNSACGCGTGR